MRTHNPGAPIRAVRLALATCLIIAAAACSRAVSVGSTPNPVYAVAVTNGSAEELIVSYDDGSGPRALGAVRSGATERFVIASPARTVVQISGRSQTGRSAGPVAVQLAAGETRPVTLR